MGNSHQNEPWQSALDAAQSPEESMSPEQWAEHARNLRIGMGGRCADVSGDDEKKVFRAFIALVMRGSGKGREYVAAEEARYILLLKSPVSFGLKRWASTTYLQNVIPANDGDHDSAFARFYGLFLQLDNSNSTPEIRQDLALALLGRAQEHSIYNPDRALRATLRAWHTLILLPEQAAAAQYAMTRMIGQYAQQDRQKATDFLLDRLAPKRGDTGRMELSGSPIEQPMTDIFAGHVDAAPPLLEKLSTVASGLAHSRQGSPLAKYCQSRLPGLMDDALSQFPHRAITTLLAVRNKVQIRLNPDYDTLAAAILEGAVPVLQKAGPASEDDSYLFQVFTRDLPEPLSQATQVIASCFPPSQKNAPMPAKRRLQDGGTSPQPRG